MKQRIQKEHQKQVILREKAVQLSTLTNPKEKGRSMVEMLGVLAVIGVLSVGGIMGYKYGMMKYRVNETINELNIMANTYGVQMQQMAEEQTLPSEGELLSEENAVTRMGYGYEVLGFDNHFEIALFNVPNPECEQLQKTGWELPYDIQVAEVTVEKCGTLVYYIDNGLTGTLTEYVDSDKEDSEEDDDDNNPCNKAGTESWDGSVCHCKSGYLGTYCEQCDTVGGFERQDVNGKCYSSVFCSDEETCNGHGRALMGSVYYLGICACFECDAGYYGTYCENYGGNDVCSGHGVWAIDHNEGWNGCFCDEGYFGRNCELTDKEKECSGHGAVMGYGHCFCEEGWSGENCEKEEAYVTNCVNGITTIINGEERCVCKMGWSGETCEAPVCNGRGRLDADNKCICDEDYSPESNCTERACGGNGRLNENGECECYSVGAYEPDSNCQIRACGGNGTLNSEGQCVCNARSYFSNGTCVRITTEAACNNRGMVIDGKCVCYKEYDPSTNCKEEICNGHGILNDDGTCSCYSDYNPKTDCKEQVCNGAGNLNDDGTCNCYARYGGLFCEEAPCVGGYYQNGKCYCSSGYVRNGDACIPVTGECNSRGAKIDGKCVCIEDYTPESNCKTRACNGNGYLDSNGKCVCNVDKGYRAFAGTDCSVNCYETTTCPENAIIGVLKNECTCLYVGSAVQ